MCRLRSIAAHRIGTTLSGVCLSVCLLSGSHTFVVVMDSYVSQETHAFLGMLPLFLYQNSSCRILCWISTWYALFVVTFKTRYVSYIPSLRLGDIETHNSFRKTSYMYAAVVEWLSSWLAEQEHCGQSITACSMRLLFTFSPGHVLRSVCQQFFAYKDNTCT